MKLFDLTGRRALITGGSRGLGKSMAKAFADAGAEILITARHEDELKAAAKEIGPKCEWKVVDLGKPAEAEALGKSAGRIDILVNNAGTNLPQPIDQVTDESWATMMELNLHSAMRLQRALVPGMKERRWGRVIHISSVLGIGGKEGRNGYCASKAAVIGLAHASAIDLGPFGVTVNCIAPGPFLTDMPMSVLSDAEKQVFADRTALGRWAQPTELVGPAIMMCSEAGSYVTGQVLFVDGGYLAR